MFSILITLLKGLGICAVFLYLIFCLFLGMVAKPSDSEYIKSKMRFYFEEEPKGFIKFSIMFGNLFCITFVIIVLISIFYIIGNGNCIIERH